MSSPRLPSVTDNSPGEGGPWPGELLWLTGATGLWVPSPSVMSLSERAGPRVPMEAQE